MLPAFSWSVAGATQERAFALTLGFATDALSECEPLIAHVTIKNVSSAEQMLLRIHNSDEAVRFSVWGASGERLYDSPVSGRLSSAIASFLAPGKASGSYHCVSRFHRFAKVGRYTVRAYYSVDGRTLAEDSRTVTVTPLDEKRLAARCEELFRLTRPERSPSELAPIPRDVYWDAFLAVAHDVALPYYDYIAQEWDNRYVWPACQAIALTGTERANKVLSALSLRKDSTGERARAALKAREKRGE